jgi:hypothetical protein
MSKTSVVDLRAAPPSRRRRLGVAARVGVFAGAAGIALLPVASASASAAPLRTRHLVRTRHVASTRHIVRTRSVVRSRYVLRSHPAQPVVTSSSVGGAWACIRSHESGGNYATNTGNGYYGAYQFSLLTWYSLGGHGLPSQASPAEQDIRAQMLQARNGWAPWPQTSRMCGV